MVEVTLWGSLGAAAGGKNKVEIEAKDISGRFVGHSPWLAAATILHAAASCLVPWLWRRNGGVKPVHELNHCQQCAFWPAVFTLRM